MSKRFIAKVLICLVVAPINVCSTMLYSLIKWQYVVLEHSRIFQIRNAIARFQMQLSILSISDTVCRILLLSWMQFFFSNLLQILLWLWILPEFYVCFKCVFVWTWITVIITVWWTAYCICKDKYKRNIKTQFTIIWCSL